MEPSLLPPPALILPTALRAVRAPLLLRPPRCRPLRPLPARLERAAARPWALVVAQPTRCASILASTEARPRRRHAKSASSARRSTRPRDRRAAVPPPPPRSLCRTRRHSKYSHKYYGSLSRVAAALPSVAWPRHAPTSLAELDSVSYNSVRPKP